MEAVERSTSLEGLRRFLADHEPCDAGFDVGQPGGNGKGLISIACRDCGKSFEYAPGTIEIEREIEFSPAPVPEKPTVPALKRPKNQRRDRVLAASVLLLVLTAFAFALVRINETHYGSASDAPVSTQPATLEPSQPRRPEPTAKAKPETKPPARKSAGLENEKPLRLERFSLAVPAGWTHGPAEGGTVIGPPGTSPATVQVFFEDGARGGLRAMAGQSVRFAQARVGGKPTGAVGRTLVAGYPAFELTVKGATRSQLVLGILAGATHYLVIGNIDENATARQRTAVRRALQTFRPS